MIAPGRTSCTSSPPRLASEPSCTAYHSKTKPIAAIASTLAFDIPGEGCMSAAQVVESAAIQAVANSGPQTVGRRAGAVFTIVRGADSARFPRCPHVPLPAGRARLLRRANEPAVRSGSVTRTLVRVDPRPRQRHSN